MKNHITLKQKIVEILAYVLMWASIVIGIIWSAKLPKEVATHFDAAGNVEMQMDMDLRIPFCFYQLLC